MRPFRALDHPAPSLAIAGHIDFGEGHALPVNSALADWQ